MKLRTGRESNLRGAHLLTVLATVLCLGMFAGTGWAQPRLVVTKGELSHDFGKVSRHKKLSCTLTLTNRGNQPAQLKRVQKSCGGCSPLRLNKATLRPGKSIVLDQRYKAGGKAGRQRRTHFVRTNDPNLTSETLKIVATWEVQAFLDLRPETIDFGRKLFASTWDGKITIRTGGLKEKVAVRKVETSSPHLRVGRPRMERGGQKIVVPLSIGPGAPLGKFSEKVVLRTNYEKEPVLEVPVRGEIQGPFVTSKRYISFGVVARGKGASREIDVSVRPRGRWKITGAQYDKSLLACELSGDASRGYRLRADLAEGLEAGSCRTTVTLETNCPAQPRIALPVLAVVREKGK